MTIETNDVMAEVRAAIDVIASGRILPPRIQDLVNAADKAADTIERLREENAWLEGLLWRAMDDASIEPGDWYAEARAALTSLGGGK